MNNTHNKVITKKNPKIKHAFCDFDDTITRNSCLLYSKYRFLTQNLNHSHVQAYKILKPYITFNMTFFKIIKKYGIQEITILSYNNSKLIKQIYEDNKNIFFQYNVKVNVIYGEIHKKDKYSLIPENSTYIADIFEYSYWKDKNYVKFICVDGDYSLVKYYFILIKKIIYYIGFRVHFIRSHK